jgi:hypothetical protein
MYVQIGKIGEPNNNGSNKSKRSKQEITSPMSEGGEP